MNGGFLMVFYFSKNCSHAWLTHDPYWSEAWKHSSGFIRVS